MTLKISEVVNHDASLISRRAWSDPAIYELEKKGIFGKAWLFLGHESQIRNRGDFVQAYMCETPVILARGHDDGNHFELVGRPPERSFDEALAAHQHTAQQHLDSVMKDRK